jgi:Ca2+-transporting ATPase
MASTPPGGRTASEFPPHHSAATERVAALLATDQAHGLSAAESAARLARNGPNLISVSKATPWWRRLLSQFAAPLVLILAVAAIVAALLGEPVDAAVIFGVVLLNAAIGFIEEMKAVRAIDALVRGVRVQATVRRDGERRRIDASGLVVGDIVLLEAGDKVPADLRLLRSTELEIDESALTGESQPVSKDPAPLPKETVLADRASMAYAGTLAVRGTAEGAVTATGDASEVGRVQELIASADDLETPLTRKIAALSALLLKLILAIAAVAFTVGLLRGEEPVVMFKAAVALAVAAIPEGLPAAVTIMLAVGVSRMASRRAIIRRLPAVEALGATTVICSDKTGTLTRNEMTVARLAAGGMRFAADGTGYEPIGAMRREQGEGDLSRDESRVLHALLLSGVCCNDASLRAPGAAGADDRGRWTIEGDPTEAALLVSARKFDGDGLREQALAERMPRLDAVPFESARQYMATLHADGARRRMFVKGSVERVVALATHARDAQGAIAPIDRAAVLADAEEFAREGLRVLAFAERELPAETEKITHASVERSAGEGDAHGLVFLGLQGMLDPPRDEAIESVRRCLAAGIRVKMITGDHAGTAAAIAARIGIGGDGANGGAPRALTGAELASTPDAELPDVAERFDVFARMTPEQKLRLVRALQGRGHIVAMTGDGVNDAPALRQADIGVAMGITGTEVAKESADMVLADDNFASIEAAVEEGRTVDSNLTKFLAWTLPTNGGEGFVILAAIMLGWPMPILPIHALYVNMVTAVLLGMPLIFEARDAGIMSRPPRDPKRPLLGFELLMRTAFVSLILCVGAMTIFHGELARGASEASARTAAISVIVIGEIFYLFPARAMLEAAWRVPLLSNRLLWAGIAAMLAVHALFVYAPPMQRIFGSEAIHPSAWWRILAAGVAVLVLVEVEKAIRRALAPNRRLDGI